MFDNKIPMNPNLVRSFEVYLRDKRKIVLDGDKLICPRYVQVCRNLYGNELQEIIFYWSIFSKHVLIGNKIPDNVYDKCSKYVFRVNSENSFGSIFGSVNFNDLKNNNHEVMFKILDRNPKTIDCFGCKENKFLSPKKKYYIVCPNCGEEYCYACYMILRDCPYYVGCDFIKCLSCKRVSFV